MKLCTVIASTRPNRLAGQIADWFTAQADADADIDHEVADLAKLNLPFLDEPEHPSARVYHHDHTRNWSQIVDRADAFVFITPEYNYGMPATLKNALDFLYHEWAHKPVGFVSYGGTSAGTRGVQMTKQVVTTLRMFPIGATVAIPTRQYVTDGVLRADETLDTAATAVLAELHTAATAFAQIRMA